MTERGPMARRGGVAGWTVEGMCTKGSSRNLRGPVVASEVRRPPVEGQSAVRLRSAVLNERTSERHW